MSSTSKVVVAYVSMTRTPFRSSIGSPAWAACSRTYSFRAIRWDPRARVCIAASLHASGSYGSPTFPPRVRALALTDVLARVEADAGKALEILKEYVRFPTISAHKRAQPETAAFVRRLLVENGFEAREYSSDCRPNIVIGQMIVDERKPTLRM